MRHMTREKKSPERKARGPARVREVDVDLDGLGDPLTVSDLAPVPGRSDRLRVSVNGVEFGDVTLDFVADERLRSGLTLTRAQAGDVLGAVRRTIVLDKALDLLAVRARSGRDLRVRLRRAGAPDGDITWAIDRLVRQGFLDDSAYARQVARAKVLGGGVSRRRVVTELRRRGVAADVANEAIDATLSEVDLDEEGAALNAAEKRMRALRSLEPAQQRQRLYAYLARRGFESDVVRKVIASVLR
jgi:regulatory protein